ncbi:hypothetical protein [Sphaerospermopsis sp. FACHB-1194]|nr:hypothetical protein [Sphaerospermopsis sp. FACHB-1194]MBD2144332.1 hypothetical protein [Sphaerospermopsis sp. FACHB-1194]
MSILLVSQESGGRSQEAGVRRTLITLLLIPFFCLLPLASCLLTVT